MHPPPLTPHGHIKEAGQVLRTGYVAPYNFQFCLECLETAAAAFPLGHMRYITVMI